MSRLKKTPSYCLHTQSGHAYVTIAGRQHWLGSHGTPESRIKYDRLIGEWLVNGRQAPTDAGPRAATTVSTVLAAFLEHAKTYYVVPAVNRNGLPSLDDNSKAIMVPSPEVVNYKHAMRPLRRLYGATPAAEFGPKALKVVRDAMIRDGLCRKVVNRRVGRIKMIFKWAVAAEMVPPSSYQALAAVAGLRAGRSAAPETDPVRPVPDEAIQQTLLHLHPMVAAMVVLQRLTAGIVSCL